MHARHRGNAVHTTGKSNTVSAARAQAILSQLPRNQTTLISGLSKDWKDIDNGVVSTAIEALRVSIRAYGHQAITSNISDLERNPESYQYVAHEIYVTSAKANTPTLLSGVQIRQLFPCIEFTNEQIRSVLRNAAAGVKQTPDEPKLIVVAIDNDFIITFAT